MSPRARRRAAAAALVALIAGGALAFGQFSGTFAIFTAETENPNAAALGSWIPAPSAATSSNNGTPWATEHLAWTSGHSTAMPGAAPNPVTGQSIYYADGGVATAASATCGAYGAFSTVTSVATTADVTGTQVNDWWCFEVFSTSAAATTSGSWTSDVATFTARRIFLATSFDQHNVATANTAKTSDQIVITFNQNRGAIGAGNGNVNVRFCNTPKILISTAAIANCNTAPDLATITTTQTVVNATCNASTTAGNGTTTLTITLACGGATSAIGAGTAKFVPTSGSSLTSSGGQTMCISAAAPNCEPTTTNRF